MRLLLLPGLHGTGRLFEPFIQQWNGSTTAQAIGYPTDIPQDYESLARYVGEQLPLDEDYVLLGESFSGPVAYRLAEQRPLGLRGVVFVGTFLTSPRPFLTRCAPLVPAFVFSERLAPDFLLRHVLLGGNEANRLIPLVRESVHDVPGRAIKSRIAAISHLRRPERRIDVPCLYLQAKRDRLVPKRCVEYFRSYCSNLRITTIDGPHLLMQTRPEQCAKAIADFIASL